MKSIRRAIMILVFAILGFPTLGFTNIYTAELNGANEFPANASPGIGFAMIGLDTILHTLDVQVIFRDLLGTTTASHIHGPTALPGTGAAGVITQVPSFEGFPLGVTIGAYSHSFDTTLASTWNPSFLTSVGSDPLLAEEAFSSYLTSGTAYFNIHTTGFPGGEISGFLAPVSQAQPEPVPEPATLLLFGIGMVALTSSKIRRNKK